MTLNRPDGGSVKCVRSAGQTRSVWTNTLLSPIIRNVGFTFLKLDPDQWEELGYFSLFFLLQGPQLDKMQWWMR